MLCNDCVAFEQCHLQKGVRHCSYYWSKKLKRKPTAKYWRLLSSANG